MGNYDDMLIEFAEQSRAVLGSSLVGIYLHGSAAMGCLNPDKSDIDLIVVVNDDLGYSKKRDFLRVVLRAQKNGPAKGVEMSIVKEEYCKPFVYPTPFELHFSVGCLGWLRTDLDEYILKMNGEDKDLAAHFTIIKSRGKVLFGKPIDEVFGEVDKKYYFDSLWHDIENAGEDIKKEPLYIILNLTRVLAYAKEGLILSKKEGGMWGLEKLPEEFAGLIDLALADYENTEKREYDIPLCESYAGYMLDEIRKYKYV